MIKWLTKKLVSVVNPSDEEWHAQMDAHYDRLEEEAVIEAARRDAVRATGQTSGPAFERERAKAEAHHRRVNAVAREARARLLSPSGTLPPTRSYADRPPGQGATVDDLPGFDKQADGLIATYVAELQECTTPRELTAFLDRWEAVFRLWNPSKSESTVALHLQIADRDFDVQEALECVQALGSKRPCPHKYEPGICVGSEMKIPWTFQTTMFALGSTDGEKLLSVFPPPAEQ